MIQELIILNNDGIPVFYHNFLHKSDIDEDYQLVASFLDQLSSFTKASLKKDLNTIVWEDLVFFFYTHQKTDLRLIFKCENPQHYHLIDDLAIIKRPIDTLSKVILNKFHLEYKEDLEDFKGEVSQFKPFSKIINNLFTSRKTGIL